MDAQQTEHEAFVDRKRQSRMNRIDSLPKELRELVHEYGFCVVNALIEVKVTKPERIRHVVETILNEFSPTRGSYSRQGLRTEIVSHVKGAGE